MILQESFGRIYNPAAYILGIINICVVVSIIIFGSLTGLHIKNTAKGLGLRPYNIKFNP